MSTASRLLEHVRGQEQRLVDFIRVLVEAESPSDTPMIHAGSHNAIAHALDALGFEARRVGTRTDAAHIMGVPRRRRKQMPLQLLVGHYDTVWPVGTLAKRPFSVNDNVIRGPGSFDMKGGLAQIVVALEAIAALGLEMPATPVIFVNSDEEIGSRTSTKHIRRLARVARRAFVLEPAMGPSGQLKTARKGIGRFTVKVFGRPAHAGLNPEQGSSAILELAQVIQKLFALNDAEAGVSVNVGTIDGGIQPNVIAPHSEAVVDVRVPSNADAERVEAAIRGLEPSSPKNRIHVEGGFGRPSMERTPRNQRLWAQARSLGEELGLDLEQARAGGGSDGNTTSLYTATLDGLGAVGDGAHAEHEFIFIDKTLERTALLAMLLLAPLRIDDAGEQGP